MYFSMRSYPHAGDPEFWRPVDPAGQNFGIRVNSSDDRGTFFMSPKAEVRPGDVIKIKGTIAGPGKVLALFYDETSTRYPFNSAAVYGDEGAFDVNMPVPEGEGVHLLRVDFRLWNVTQDDGQPIAGPVESVLTGLEILLPGEGDEPEVMPGKVSIDVPETMGQEITLEWGEAQRADLYEVNFSNTGENWQKQGETNGTTWAHFFDSTELGLWYFRIDAVNDFGRTPGDIASSTIVATVPGAVEVIDPPTEVEIGEFTIFWQAADRALKYQVYLAQEAQPWEMVGETVDLFMPVDMSERELGEWAFRVDSINDTGQTGGEVHEFLLKAKEWKPQEVYPITSVPFSGFLWPGGIISLQIPNQGTDEEPFYGIPVPEGQAFDITGDFLGHEGVIRIHGLGSSAEDQGGDA